MNARSYLNNDYPEIEDLKEINIVPLVDVMLVLLVIFMATAPLTVGGLAVKLPRSSVSSNKSLQAQPLVITIKEDGRYFVEKEAVKKTNLARKLNSIFSLRETKNVYIRADHRVAHGKVVHALSSAKQAGAEHIKILTRVSRRK